MANGQTVTDVNVKDLLPGNLQFVQVIDVDGGSPVQEPSTTTPGGLLWIHFNSITGVLGSDRTIIYQVYAPKFDNNSQYVLDPNTGAWVNATNNASVTGNYTMENQKVNNRHQPSLIDQAIRSRRSLLAYRAAARAGCGRWDC